MPVCSPPERDLEWNEDGVEGSNRFVNRVWRLAMECMDKIDAAAVEPFNGAASDLKSAAAKELYIKANQTIKKVTEDIDKSFHFNTAISAVMELVNSMYTIEIDKADAEMHSILLFCLENILLLLSPIIPHFSEELFEKMGNTGSILEQSWPDYRKDSLETDEVLVVVQVNGKLRAKFTIGTDLDQAGIKALALADERIKKYIQEKPLKKIIVIQKKQTLVNIVV